MRHEATWSMHAAEHSPPTSETPTQHATEQQRRRNRTAEQKDGEQHSTAERDRKAQKTEQRNGRPTATERHGAQHKPALTVRERVLCLCLSHMPIQLAMRGLQVLNIDAGGCVEGGLVPCGERTGDRRARAMWTGDRQPLGDPGSCHVETGDGRALAMWRRAGDRRAMWRRPGLQTDGPLPCGDGRETGGALAMWKTDGRHGAMWRRTGPCEVETTGIGDGRTGPLPCGDGRATGVPCGEDRSGDETGVRRGAMRGGGRRDT
jgi:hypothetical protein